MLMPKRVKYRKMHRGRRQGIATRGATVAFGDFGLQAMEACWMSNRQIEAARRAMTRHVKRGGRRTARRELYELRFKHAVGQLENWSQIGKVRHDIARIMTVLTERELGIEVVTEAPEELPAPAKKTKKVEFVDEEGESEEPAAEAEAAEPVMEQAPVEEPAKPKRGRKSKEEKA